MGNVNLDGEEFEFLSSPIKCEIYIGIVGYHRLSATSDGRYLLVSVASGSQGHMYLLDTSTGEMEEILPPEDHEIDSDASISPNGQWVAYTTIDGVWKISIGGGEPILVAEADYAGGYYYDYPAWSPDGQYLALALCEFSLEDETPEYWICTIPADGGTLQKVIRGGIEPSWSPDGENIAFISDSTIWNEKAIYICPWEGGIPIKITNPPKGDDTYTHTSKGEGMPCWSPDCEWIVFRSDVREEPLNKNCSSLWKIKVSEGWGYQ